METLDPLKFCESLASILITLKVLNETVELADAYLLTMYRILGTMSENGALNGGVGPMWSAEVVSDSGNPRAPDSSAA